MNIFFDKLLVLFLSNLCSTRRFCQLGVIGSRTTLSLRDEYDPIL